MDAIVESLKKGIIETPSWVWGIVVVGIVGCIIVLFLILHTKKI